jgi:hypothetical protein
LSVCQLRNSRISASHTGQKYEEHCTFEQEAEGIITVQVKTSVNTRLHENKRNTRDASLHKQRLQSCKSSTEIITAALCAASRREQLLLLLVEGVTALKDVVAGGDGGC